ncbi:MAG: cytochrome c [Desulfobacterales bacterium]|jgi:mono/diheme cytochrome c family protein
MSRHQNFLKAFWTWSIIVLIPVALFAHDWNAPEKAAQRPNPVPKDAAAIERGQKLYQQFCANCHGKNGQGDGPLAAALNPKPANLAARAGHHTDGDFAWKVANGRGVMPGFKNQLKETQIWELVHYIQNFKN